MGQLKIPKIWRRALVVAIPKPEKSLGDPKSYQPISLLCVPFKILEKLIYARVETVIDPLLPQEQASFRHGRSAVDQVTQLTQDIDDSFSAKKKAGAVFVDLTAAYNTVWRHGLVPASCCNCCRIDTWSTWSWRWLAIAALPFPPDGQRSKLRRLKNGVPQGSVLAPLLFNIYISDLPTTTSRKYEYLQIWKLKLSTTKTLSAAFHLNNKEAKRELKVNVSNETLPFCSETKCLGVTFDMSLTYRWHIESLHKKLTSCVALLRRFAGSSWGAGATTLQTATLVLVHSTAEYCAPVWCRSTHTCLIDPTINDALRIVTGSLRPTTADNLPILTGIQPAELCRSGATLSLGRQAMEPGHMLHSALTCTSSAVPELFKSRHPFVHAAQQLISLSDNNQRWATATLKISSLQLSLFAENTSGTTPLVTEQK